MPRRREAVFGGRVRGATRGVSTEPPERELAVHRTDPRAWRCWAWPAQWSAEAAEGQAAFAAHRHPAWSRSGRLPPERPFAADEWARGAAADYILVCEPSHCREAASRRASGGSGLDGSTS